MDFSEIEFPSVHPNLDESFYHAFPALNASSINKLADCPAMCRFSLDNPQPPTENMRLGTLLHSMVLEPESLDKYGVISKPLTTKDGKAEKAALEEAGKTVYKQDAWDTACSMADAVKAHPRIQALLQLPGESELSIFWDEEGTTGQPIHCKARVDRLITTPDGTRVALDLKTAQEVNPHALSKKIFDFGYHAQAAWYLEGLAKVGLFTDSFCFAFVRSTPPHLVVPVLLTAEALDFGRKRYEAMLAEWEYCQQNNVWPGYADYDFIDLNLPSWAYR